MFVYRMRFFEDRLLSGPVLGAERVEVTRSQWACVACGHDGGGDRSPPPLRSSPLRFPASRFVSCTPVSPPVKCGAESRSSLRGVPTPLEWG